MEAERFIKMTLSGDAELQMVFRDLPDKVREKIVKQVLRKTAQPVIAAMEKFAPRSEGYSARFRRSRGHAPLSTLIAVNIKSRGPNAQRATIGAIRPEGAQAHLTDLGTVQRFKKGDSRMNSLRALGIGRITGRQLKYLRRMGLIEAMHLNSGAVTGTHWVERSWESVKGKVVEGIEKDLVKGILDEAARLAKQYGVKK